MTQLPDQAKLALENTQYLNDEAHSELSKITGSNYGAIQLLSASTFHEGKLMLEVLKRLDHKVAQGAAFQASIMGFTADATFEASFKIGDTVHTMASVKSQLGINKLAENSSGTALSWGRLCRIFANDTKSYLLANTNLLPVMYRKYGARVGAERHLCFVGAENVIEPNSNAAKAFLKIQALADARDVRLGLQKEKEFKWENRAIEFFMAKGGQARTPKGVPTLKKKKKSSKKETDAEDDSDDE